MDPADLTGQFVVTRADDRVPSGWVRRNVDGWTVATHPALATRHVRGPDGAVLGIVAGHVVEDGLWHDQDPVTLSEGTSMSSWLDGCGGRWFALVGEGVDGPAHVRLDPSGSLAVVYDPRRRVVASSPALVLGDELESELDDDLYKALGLPSSGAWIPGGPTPYRGIDRLLPNHLLGLDTMEPARHWPPAPVEQTDDVDAAIETIVTTLEATVDAVAARRRLHLALTAGRDSRMLLACARRHVRDTVMFVFTDPTPTVDVEAAWLMTRRFGLNTLFLTETAATPAQLDRWLLETGAGATGHIWQIHQTLRHLDPQRVVLPALAGEVGRAYYWHRTDTATNTLSGTDLLARYELPAHERLVDAADRWLGGLKGHSTFEVLDLAYIEHRLGCWAGPQQYGSVPFGEHLLPFSHRRIFEAMLALPPAYKAEQRLAVDVCRRAWPELLEVPFNRIPGLRRYVKMIERIRADPSRVKGRIAEVAGRVRRR